MELKKFDEYADSLEGRIAHWKRHLTTERFRFRHIIDSIPGCAGRVRILDIGTTPFTLFIKRLHPHYEVSTVDFTDYWEHLCDEAGVSFRVCDVERQSLPFEDGYFDVVIFTEVLEHLFVPPSKVLREIRRVIRVGGKLVISVPNVAALRHRIALLLGISPLRDLDKSIGPPHDHIHEYTMSEISSKLEHCGFTVVRKKYLQPSAIHALRGFIGEREPVDLVKAAYYAAGLLLLVPSLRVVIFVECCKNEREAK